MTDFKFDKSDFNYLKTTLNPKDVKKKKKESHPER